MGRRLHGRTEVGPPAGHISKVLYGTKQRLNVMFWEVRSVGAGKVMWHKRRWDRARILYITRFICKRREVNVKRCDV